MSEINFTIGCVEQATTGGMDPLSPPISVSKNGSLAKWRDKIRLLDLRVNDPGLSRFRSQVEDTIVRAKSLNLATLITLPEAIPELIEPPPPPPPKPDDPPRPKGKPFTNPPVAYFKPCYLAVPRSIPDPSAFQTLSVEDCLPILDLAAEHGLTEAIVPVSEPGVFLDPQAVIELQKKLAAICRHAKEKKIQIHLRNGGMSMDLFHRLQREFGCMLALNVGIAQLERTDLLDIYNTNRKNIKILLFQQVLPGLDRWKARREAMASNIKIYKERFAEFKAAGKAGEIRGKGTPLSCMLRSFHDYQDSCRNTNFNLGLFQSGEINFVPLLRELRADLEQGQDRFLIMEMVPNIKNSEFLGRYLLPEIFSGNF